MKIKRLFFRIYRYAMKHAGPGTWLFAFGKEHIAPKLAVIAAVVPIAKLIVDEMVRTNTLPGTGTLDTATPESGSDGEVTLMLVNSLVKMAAIPEWLLPALKVAGAFWALTWVFRKIYQKGWVNHNFFFKFGAKGSIAGFIVQWLFGLMLVPMTLMCAIAWYAPQDLVDNGTRIILYGFVFIYVGFGGYLHHLAFKEKDVFHSVLYVIETPLTEPRIEASYLLEKFRDTVDDLMWIGEPTASNTSMDGELMISLSILHKAKNWRNEQADNFGKLLHDLEKSMLLDNCKIAYRRIPEEIKKKMSPMWREIYCPPQSRQLPQVRTSPKLSSDRRTGPRKSRKGRNPSKK